MVSMPIFVYGLETTLGVAEEEAAGNTERKMQTDPADIFEQMRLKRREVSKCCFGG
jgi:hypothetical protein